MHRFKNAPFGVWKGENGGEIKKPYMLSLPSLYLAVLVFSVEEGLKRIKASRTMRFQLKTH